MLIIFIIYFIFVAVIYILLAALTCVLSALIFLFDRRRKVINNIHAEYFRMFVCLNPYWNIKVEGLENIDSSQAYVIICNHNNQYDIPMLYSSLVPPTKLLVGKIEATYSVVGISSLIAGHIYINRNKRKQALEKLLRMGTKSLERGVSVGIFPEGTFSPKGEIIPFKKGAFLLAKQSQKPILPVKIEGGYKLKASSRRDITINIMPAISQAEVEELSLENLITRAEALF